MNWKNNLKNLYITSNFIPRIYSFFTKPFSRNLRHIEKVTTSQTKYSVSAVIPNYNYANFLENRINSILSQTYPVSEIIILDDASTDNSNKIIKDFVTRIKKSFPEINIIYERNLKNSGKPIAQWQKAFSLAHGDFVWIAEADDYSDKNFLMSVMSAFDDKNVVLSYSNSVAINKNGYILSYDFAMHAGKLNKSHFSHSYINDGKKEIEEYLIHRCTIPNVSAVVFRKRKDIPFNKYLEEAKQFIQVGDLYFYIQVLSHGKIAFSRQALNYFRLSGASVTSKSRNSKEHFAEIEKVKNIYKEQNG